MSAKAKATEGAKNLEVQHRRIPRRREGRILGKSLTEQEKLCPEAQSKVSHTVSGPHP